MSTAVQVVNIHSSRITLEEMQVELRVHPLRLEEKETFWGNTPLMSAAKFGNVAVVEFLLLIGANIHAKNNVWMSKLIFSCWSRFHWFKLSINDFLNILLKRCWRTQQFDGSFESHVCCVTSDIDKRVSVLLFFVFLIICFPLVMFVMFVVRTIKLPWWWLFMKVVWRLFNCCSMLEPLWMTRARSFLINTRIQWQLHSQYNLVVLVFAPNILCFCQLCFVVDKIFHEINDDGMFCENHWPQYFLTLTFCIVVC